jgi:colanic acid/amylovoran biosynthesis glycosyltransferase
MDPIRPSAGTKAPVADTPMPQPIAYLTSQYPAPSHTFVAREIAALERRGWRIEVFSIRPGDSQSRPSPLREVAQTYCVLQQRPHTFAFAHLTWILTHPHRYFRTARFALAHRAPGFRSLLLAAAHFAEAAALARELNRRGCVHLHNHFANSAATVGLLAAKLAGIGWSFTMHGISETDYPAGLLLGEKIKSADWVACASWFMRAQGLRTIAPSDWGKLQVIRCGVSLEQLRFTPRKQPNVTTGALICVGRLSPEKAHAGLFEAFLAISRKHPSARLRLIGDGPCRLELVELAARLGLSAHIDFLGACPEEDTLAQIAHSDLLVLPSLLEGLPVVLMEAMAQGVPVVAPRLAGIPELVDHGATGLLFTPSDWDDLATQIIRLLNDGALRASIAIRAREKIENEFDIQNSSEALSRKFLASRDKLRSSPPSLTLRFGLREAIVLALLVIGISIAVALTSNLSTPGPQPFPGSAPPPK